MIKKTNVLEIDKTAEKRESTEGKDECLRQNTKNKQEIKGAISEAAEIWTIR